MRRKRDTIRILFLLPTYAFGGAERTSLNLLNGINKDKFRITLVTSRTVYQHFQNIDIEKFLSVEDLGINVWFTRFRRFVHDVRRIASLVKIEKPDLAFGMMHYPSSLLVFAQKLYNLDLKVIASPRGPSVEYLRYFEHKVFRKMILKRIFSFFCRHAHGIVVSSRGMKEECVKYFHASPERVNIIPNSIDFDDIRIKAGEYGDVEIPPGFYLISTSGRLEKEKNIPFLFRAFSTVRKSEKVKLLVIGDGTEKENLARVAQQLNIGEDVIFVGYQKNPYKFIRRSDIFVHTCLFEGFANVIIEAMACGVPVVAMDCPYGPRDIIRHMRDGMLIPMNDEEGLVEAIVTLLHNRTLMSNLIQRGSERVLDFSINTMIEKYEHFFLHVQGATEQ